MEEIITLNGKKYVEYIEPEKEYKRWRTEEWKDYYVILSNWEIDVHTHTDSNIDDLRYNIGNYFQTEQEAIKESDKRLAVVRVNDKILELNEWWKPDWNDFNEDKYCIIYRNNMKLFCCEVSNYIKNTSNIYYIKSEEIVEQIIKEHQEDLKLIFDIWNL